MITKHWYDNTGDRQFVRDLCAGKRVIDVGGGCGGVFRDLVEAIVDINDYQIPNVRLFQGDMNLPEVWDDIRFANRIEMKKYDFAICSMTLEDITSPLFVTQQIERFAKAGVIIVPSKYRELTRNLHNEFRGFIHHHSIFNIENNILVRYPKLNVIEHSRFDQLAGQEDKTEIIILWEGSIGMKELNDGFLGPTHGDVERYYNGLFD